MTVVSAAVLGAAVVVSFFLLLGPALMITAILRPRRQPGPPEPTVDFGCIITAYRNAELAEPLVEALRTQTHGNQHTYLVADRCEHPPQIDDLQCTILRPDPPLDLKIRSIRYATDHFVRDHDYIVTLDADNLVTPDFLEQLSRYAAQGVAAVQGVRVAANTDTPTAALDALGEVYKNHVDRFAPAALGSSAVISGSGMAVRSDLHHSYVGSPAVRRGEAQGRRILQEDKLLQNHLVAAGNRIHFAPEAICHDRKIETPDQLETQRARWLFSYFQNVPNSLHLLGAGLRHASWNRFLFGLVSISPPLFILAGSALVVLAASLFTAPALAGAIALSLLAFGGAVLYSLHAAGAPRSVWMAIPRLPMFIGRQARALAQMRDPEGNFQPTEHRRP